MIESRQDTDFRTVFRIFIGCFNSLFFVPNFQSKFWQGDQIYLIIINEEPYQMLRFKVFLQSSNG